MEAFCKLCVGKSGQNLLTAIKSTVTLLIIFGSSRMMHGEVNHLSTKAGTLPGTHIPNADWNNVSNQERHCTQGERSRPHGPRPSRPLSLYLRLNF